jgi:hypothetical protein
MDAVPKAAVGGARLHARAPARLLFVRARALPTTLPHGRVRRTQRRARARAAALTPSAGAVNVTSCGTHCCCVRAQPCDVSAVASREKPCLSPGQMPRRSLAAAPA